MIESIPLGTEGAPLDRFEFNTQSQTHSNLVQINNSAKTSQGPELTPH